MKALLATSIALSLAAAQLALESLLDAPDAVPLLPIALVAAWAVVRDPAEPALALPPVAWVLGVTSEQSVGWLLIALVPSVLLGAAWRAAGRNHAIAAATLAGATSALAYLAILDTAALPDLLPMALATTGSTAVAALAVALALYPFRPRERGLFG